jgi:hypothetical protein
MQKRAADFFPPNIGRKWRRLVAVGCTHGEYINPQAFNLVARYLDRWKPEIRIHLGDAFDTKAFRTGARPNSGDADEAAPIEGDLAQGRKFLKLFKPTVCCDGNHEHRLVKLAQHYNVVIQTAARAVLDEIRSAQGAEKIPIIPYTVHERGWHHIGNYKFGHGHLFGENFLRDSAERWGSCVIAHAHRAGVAKGRRSDCPTAFCVGTLADIPVLDYASGRPNTLSWSHGVVHGETDGERTMCWLSEWPQGEMSWRIPV